MAIKFFVPTFLTDSAFDTFGRIRPAHVNGLLFGFLSSGLIGAMYYVAPRLSHVSLYKPILGKAAAVLWNGGVLVGVILIMSGDTQAREYAEMPWVVDVVIMITLIIIGITIIGTIIKRRERKLYVSLWFFAAIFLWFPIVYFVGNVMWRPPSGALFGLTDAIVNWFYGHNVLGLWFTPFGLALWYYFIPKLTKRALYSVTLSLISFFALAFFYTGVGGHHLLAVFNSRLAQNYSGCDKRVNVDFSFNVCYKHRHDNQRNLALHVQKRAPSIHYVRFHLLHTCFNSGNFPSVSRHKPVHTLFSVDSDAFTFSAVRCFCNYDNGHDVLVGSQNFRKNTLEQKTNGCLLVGNILGLHNIHGGNAAGWTGSERKLVYPSDNRSSIANTDSLLHSKSHRRRNSCRCSFSLCNRYHNDYTFKTFFAS